uniref:Neprosin PEP catalytic domain-containing protein n=1 Tax=Hordeum vulgare subsp. vulgare TaxID=112509 RepID=A0A8I6YMY0_HORVV
MRPSYNPKGMHHDSNITPHLITQTWHQNGKCPEHTIPIRRTKEEHVLRASSVRRFGRKMPRSIPLLNPTNDTNTPNILRGHQYATASARYDKCYGTKGTFNMWKPAISRANDFSLTQLWITAGSYNGNNLNTIEAGWQVYPDLYSDSNARLFIYWTRDAYQTTGCYNLLCSGFIQTSNQITIGGSISPTSNYGGTQYDIDILVWKDRGSGNWWLQVGGYNVGYWPSYIFSNLTDSASTIMWGGEIFSPDVGQTSTHMGSGHFPNEGFGKASYIKNIQVVDSFNRLNPPSDVGLITEQNNCYNVESGNSSDWGTYIYYGGPGNNPNCP